MSSSAQTKRDVLQLIRLAIYLPLFLLFIGIALTVAAVIGRLPLLGGIILEPGKHRRYGRAVAFVLGLMVWFGVWGGLGLVAVRGYSFSGRNDLPPVATQRTFATALPTATSKAMMETPTAAPALLPSPTTVPTATTPPRPAATPAPAEPPSPSPTLPPPNTPTASPTESPAEPVNFPKALEAVRVANILLRLAIVAPDDDHLQALATAWSGDALAQVQTFAGQMNRKYNAPLEVSYQMLGDLTLDATSGNPPDAVVSSTELWQFKGRTVTRTAATAYRYTLRKIDGRWKIITFAFEVLPTPTPVTFVP